MSEGVGCLRRGMALLLQAHSVYVAYLGKDRLITPFQKLPTGLNRHVWTVLAAVLEHAERPGRSCLALPACQLALTHLSCCAAYAAVAQSCRAQDTTPALACGTACPARAVEQGGGGLSSGLATG